MKLSEGKDLCAFCRTPPASSSEDEIKRIHELIDKGNPEALYTLSGGYLNGIMGMPQDYQKANELFLKAGELGRAGGYGSLGHSYHFGLGVAIDMKKAKYYYELAAVRGDVAARNNLACLEGEIGNETRAYKHMIIAAKAGSERSLD